MPYIDSTPALSPYKIYEGNMQHGFMDLLLQHGWTKALEFKRAVVSTHFVTEHDITARHDDGFIVANHIIVRNARGDLFGFATVAAWDDYTSHDLGFPHYNFFTGKETEKEALVKYMETEYEKRKANTTMYLYMLEKLPKITEGDTLLLPWGLETEDDKRLQMALDVEVIAVDFKSTNAGSEYIKAGDMAVMQSPIVEMALRAKFTENIDYPYMDTNWWADSEVSIQGHLDSKSMFLILQTDNTPLWEDNVVPIVPLYFGAIDSVDPGDPAVALFAGTVPEGADAKAVAKYNFDDVTVKGGRRIMPVTKTYPSNPSNGIDSVMINRAKLGARYQSYYLSWNTAPNSMAPARANDAGDKQYPRAWEGMKDFQFNPSAYSKKVQTSFVYLVHPEEGIRGHLRNSVGLNSANINTSELRISKEDCPEKIYDVYQCVPVSGISPLTKRPATHYRPMGLGVFKGELNLDSPYKEDPNDKTAPANVTDLKGTSPQKGVAALSWAPPTDADFHSTEILVDSEVYAKGVMGIDGYVLKGLTTGSATITVVSVDKAGNKSSGATATVTVI